MTTNIERRFLTGNVELRAAGDDGRTIRGTAAVINQLSPDLGGFREIIAPGAFADADMSSVVGLFNHDRNLLLGRTEAGTVRLNLTESGLDYEIDPPDTQCGRDLCVSMDRGDVTQSSFAFSIARNGDDWDEEPDGLLRRTITAISRVYDVSPVTEPAYPQTSVALRSLECWREQHATDEPDFDGAARLRLARAKLNLLAVRR